MLTEGAPAVQPPALEAEGRVRCCRALAARFSRAPLQQARDRWVGLQSRTGYLRGCLFREEVVCVKRFCVCVEVVYRVFCVYSEVSCAY